jgi:signal transduction histidine kinase
MILGVPRHLSLLWKILLSTSIAITALLALTGWFVQDQSLSVLTRSLEHEIRGSFRAYESLWQSRAETLRSVSLVLSNMSDVRAAFGTRDGATIRDTAAEIWSKISESNAIFFVTDPNGEVIASLGGGQSPGRSIPVVREAAARFPAQSDGFAVMNGELFELVVTPVYVDTGTGPGLLNVLVAGFAVDEKVADELKQRTGGSDFVFRAGGRVVASTLPAKVSSALADSYAKESRFSRVQTGAGEYALFGSRLLSVQKTPVGELLIARSFASIRQSIDSLEQTLIVVWIAAIIAGLAGSYLLARRLLLPVRQLDQAASRIARQEYGTRVPDGGKDELGRLARTFNAMCSSIESARGELIRQERLSTIGRLSSSIVHDLRNPLAAIYGGAEMLMDGDLNEAQTRRVTANIYRSSRSIKEMLQDLVNASRGSAGGAEPCHLAEVVEAAVEAQTGVAEEQNVEMHVNIDRSIEVPLERARMERVFLNLLNNAIEAMPTGGEVNISARQEEDAVTIIVQDTGPGIPVGIRDRLFEPFATAGKAGLGLGLALSRQTVRDHGGELSVDITWERGARFFVRLPFRFHKEVTTTEQTASR